MKQGLSADDQMGGAERAMSLFDDVVFFYALEKNMFGLGVTSTRKRATIPRYTSFSHKICLPIGEAKAVRFERSSQSLGQKHFQFAFSAAPESSGLSCYGREQLEAKVAFGSSVPISPETTEWRTQSVQLHSQSPKEAFLQGSLDNGFTWAVFWQQFFNKRSELRHQIAVWCGGFPLGFCACQPHTSIEPKRWQRRRTSRRGLRRVASSQKAMTLECLQFQKGPGIQWSWLVYVLWGQLRTGWRWEYVIEHSWAIEAIENGRCLSWKHFLTWKVVLSWLVS